MPKSQLEIDIEKATNENVVSEDWSLILDIVDRINQTNSEKEALKLIVKRLNAKDPHISMHALTLLSACVSNCSRNFKLEVCSRDFTDEIRQIILKKKFPKLSEKLAFLVFEWSNDREFKNDPALSLMSSLYADLRKNGIEFKKEEPQKPSTRTNFNTSKEDEDLAKAIQLSLKEKQNPKHNIASNLNDSLNKQQTTSLFGSIPQISASNYPERRKVKALYDFEAAEENELTFKAGDLLIVIDDSDPNWWKGSNLKQEGLFPSNFVTADLTAEIESATNKEQENTKKVSFNDEVSVKTLPVKISIDEKRIDECLDLIKDADPTGEIKPDSDEFLQLEDSCYAMGPLIDHELQIIDQKHAMLEDLNLKLLEGFQMYHNLMKESIYKQNTIPSVHGQANIIGLQQNYQQTQNMLNSQQQFSQAPFHSLSAQTQPSQPTTTTQSAYIYQTSPMSILQNPSNPSVVNNITPTSAYQFDQQYQMSYQNYPGQNPYQNQQQQQQITYQLPANTSNTNLPNNLNDYIQMQSVSQVPNINTAQATNN